MTESYGLTLTPERSLDSELVKLCKSVTAKRARTVIDHILKHGVITNEDLSETYGYDHPPRAIRDVRENGIPLITHSVTSPKTGRRMGAYTFGKLDDIRHGRIGGRKAFSKQFKQELITKYGSRDAFSGEPLDERYLQIDHRVPYQVGGDTALDPDEYMLIDASSQRAKSWSCEHCENFTATLDINICKSCFWASPESYTHVALSPHRRIDIVWRDKEISQYDELRADADKFGISVQQMIKKKLSK